MRRKVLLIPALAVGCAVSAIMAWRALEPPSVTYAKGSVNRLIFLRGERVLLSNHLGEVYASDSGGSTWTKVADRAFGLSVADGVHVWGVRGWQGIHERPSATVWYSGDEGRTWSRTDLKLPPGFGHEPAVRRRLPGVLVNAPSGPPTVLMQDFQLARPKPGAQFDNWDLIGKPVPAVQSGRLWRASGVVDGNTVYVAANDRIYMSLDGGHNWSEQKVHDFVDARMACRESTCFALLSQLGSAWNGVFLTISGSNDWRPLGSLELDDVRRALDKHAEGRDTIATFGACAIVPTADGVLVGGIVNAGQESWGAVLVVESRRPLRALPGVVPDGILELGIDGRGRLWAAGRGAFIHSADGWKSVWHSVSSQ